MKLKVKQQLHQLQKPNQQKQHQKQPLLKLKPKRQSLKRKHKMAQISSVKNNMLQMPMFMLALRYVSLRVNWVWCWQK